MSDPVKPSHYHRDSGHEVLEVIEAWGLGFVLGNVVKYVARAGQKGDELTDLRKAREYLDRRIERLVAKASVMVLGWRGQALCVKCGAPGFCQAMHVEKKNAVAPVCLGCLGFHNTSAARRA